MVQGMDRLEFKLDLEPIQKITVSLRAKRHLRRTAFGAVQVSSLLFTGDCFAPAGLAMT